MMTSSNGNIFRVTGPLCGEFTGPGEFPTQRPVTRSFDVFFDLRLNKRLSKQPWGWWFETLSWSLWRQCNVFGDTVSNTHTSFAPNGCFSQATLKNPDPLKCMEGCLYVEATRYLVVFAKETVRIESDQNFRDQLGPNLTLITVESRDGK